MQFICLEQAEVWAMIAVLVFICFDMLVGIFGAIVRKDFQSAIMREGLYHKAMLIIVVLLAVMIQGFSGYIADLGFDVPLILPVCIYIIVMEIGSVLETIANTYPELADSPILKLFSRKGK